MKSSIPEKMQPPSFAGASPFLLLRYVAVAPLMAPQLVCPSLSTANLSKRLIYSKPLDGRHISPRKSWVFRIISSVLFVTIPWPPAKSLCQATPWQSGCARQWRKTPDLKAQHLWWGEIHKVERGHSCPKHSCPCHALLQYYARRTCCCKELWEVRSVEDQDISRYLMIFAHKVSWRAFAIQTSGMVHRLYYVLERLCKTEFKHKMMQNVSVRFGGWSCPRPNYL